MNKLDIILKLIIGLGYRYTILGSKIHCIKYTDIIEVPNSILNIKYNIVLRIVDIMNYDYGINVGKNPIILFNNIRYDIDDFINILNLDYRYIKIHKLKKLIDG